MGRNKEGDEGEIYEKRCMECNCTTRGEEQEMLTFQFGLEVQFIMFVSIDLRNLCIFDLKGKRRWGKKTIHAVDVKRRKCEEYHLELCSNTAEEFGEKNVAEGAKSAIIYVFNRYIYSSTRMNRCYKCDTHLRDDKNDSERTVQWITICDWWVD